MISFFISASVIRLFPVNSSAPQKITIGGNDKAKRRILIEDFTGQFCSNCPDAHKVIHELQHQYGEGVIAVAIHAGNFGVAEGSNSKITGLMQPEGNTYADYWGVEAYPAGLINRTSGLLKHTDWAAYAREALSQEAIMDIALGCKVADDSTSLWINTNVSSNAEINSQLQRAISLQHSRMVVRSMRSMSITMYTVRQ